MRWFNDLIREASGMTASDLRVMREIGESEEWTTASLICRDVRLDQAQVSRILAFFRELRWISEEPAVHDRRCKLIRFTPIGGRTYRDLRSKQDGAMRFMFELMPPADLDRFMGAIDDIEDVLRRLNWPPNAR